MWEISHNNFSRFRCYTGHSFTADSLAAELDHETEKSLWFSLQMMKERSRMYDRMADKQKSRKSEKMEKLFRKKAEEAREHAANLGKFIFSLKPSEKED